MKKSNTFKLIISFLSVLAIIGCMLHGLGYTYAEKNANPYPLVLKVGETTTVTAARAYAWTNVDPSIAKLTAARGEISATVTGLKSGVTTISVGTAVGQVISFGFTVVDENNTDDGDNAGDGDNNPGGGDNSLTQIPGLDTNTTADTVLDFNGDKWIVINNITMEGFGYALLLKQSALSVKCFSLSGERYEGSELQKEFTNAYSGSYIPSILMNNAVVPILNGDASNAVSAPTSKLAVDAEVTKDIIFPLSYKEAADWAGSSTGTKLYMNGQRWWLRTPNDSKWYYVAPSGVPDTGHIISSPTIGINGNELYLRPAIWIKYDLSAG